MGNCFISNLKLHKILQICVRSFVNSHPGVFNQRPKKGLNGTLNINYLEYLNLFKVCLYYLNTYKVKKRTIMYLFLELIKNSSSESSNCKQRLWFSCCCCHYCCCCCCCCCYCCGYFFVVFAQS